MSDLTMTLSDVLMDMKRKDIYSVILFKDGSIKAQINQIDYIFHTLAEFEEFMNKLTLDSLLEELNDVTVERVYAANIDSKDWNRHTILCEKTKEIKEKIRSLFKK